MRSKQKKDDSERGEEDLFMSSTWHITRDANTAGCRVDDYDRRDMPFAPDLREPSSTGTVAVCRDDVEKMMSALVEGLRRRPDIIPRTALPFSAECV